MDQFSKRQEIRILLQGRKHTVNQISNTLGVGRATVFRVQKTLKEGTSLLHKKGAGRPASLRNSMKHSVARYVWHGKKKSIREIVNDLEKKDRQSLDGEKYDEKSKRVAKSKSRSQPN